MGLFDGSVYVNDDLIIKMTGRIVNDFYKTFKKMWRLHKESEPVMCKQAR